jgi:hypothetical protein
MGKRLTKGTFETYCKEGGVVIIHMMLPKRIQTGLSTEGIAGTFTRILGKYIREEKTLHTEVQAFGKIVPLKDIYGYSNYQKAISALF